MHVGCRKRAPNKTDGRKFGCEGITELEKYALDVMQLKKCFL
jgi:hypothetical protein